MTIYHSFSTTGVHSLRLSVDVMGQVDEINDETNGSNNNVYDIDVEVMALGVRVLIANDDGTIPQTQVSGKTIPKSPSMLLMDLW